MSESLTSTWIESIRSVMERIDGFDLPEDARKVIWRCLRSELYEAADREEEIEDNSRLRSRWTKDEEDQLRQLYGGVVAKTWEDERINLLRGQLLVHRPPKIIKKKAVELRLESAVDYWLNRSRGIAE